MTNDRLRLLRREAAQVSASVAEVISRTRRCAARRLAPEEADRRGRNPEGVHSTRLPSSGFAGPARTSIRRGMALADLATCRGTKP
jgi:hypothetical protein